MVNTITSRALILKLNNPCKESSLPLSFGGAGGIAGGAGGIAGGIEGAAGGKAGGIEGVAGGSI